MEKEHKYFSDPKQYLEEYCGFEPPLTIENDVISQFLLRNYHEFCNIAASTQAMSVLEFGGGPAIPSLISIAQYAEQIVFPEYDDASRTEVEKWLKKSPEAFDWSDYFKQTVQVIEGKSKEEVAKREDELRSKIRWVIPCDLRDSKLLKWPRSSAEVPSFQVIFTSFCIECVATSAEEFRQAIQKLALLQKPGGYLVVVTTLGGSFSKVGNDKMPIFAVNEELLMESLEECGYKNVQIKSVYPEMKEHGYDKISNCDGFAFAFGKLG